MKNLKNILIINDFDYVQGGASKVAIDTANALCNQYNVIFFCGDSNENSPLDSKVKVISTKQGESLKNKNKLKGIINGIYNFKSKHELKKTLLSLDKEETIIHVHGWTKSLSCSIFDIIWKLNFKLVLTMHDYFTACPNGGYFNYKKNKICNYKPLSAKCIKCNCDSRNFGFKIYRIIRQFVQSKIVKLNKRLTDVISISDFSENILKSTLNKNTKIHRVLNPIDFKKNKNKIDFKNNDYYLYVGRISKEKGVDVFCEAITKSNLKGIVVGDGDQKEILQNKYPNIEFTGWKESKEVKEYQSKARALIFPSRWYETAGLTALEANMCGIPIIVSSNTAITDFVNDKNMIFENSNAQSLIEKINEFEKNIQNYNVEKVNFSNNYKEEIEKCYIDILNSGE